ncbi:MAG: 16S rRNA (guanine(527)-N(7))-methyltransferase RsmG [Hyphomicrobiaceae bacterium]
MTAGSSGPTRHISGPAEFQAIFGVSRETLDRLTNYADMLARWQKTINLVAPSTLGDVWHRHFADSAQLIGHIPEGAETVWDLGSGAGFPGLVLAVLGLEPGRGRTMRVRLIESDQRKAAFLREVARTVGIAVDIDSARIETISTQGKVAKVDVITSRALAPLRRLLELSRPVFGATTTGLFLKGRDVASEVEEARRSWDFTLSLEPSLTEPQARIAVVRNARPVTED